MTKRQSTKYIVIHCSDTKAGQDIGAKEIDQWHRERGFDSIGYHVVIRRKGEVQDGRPLDSVGAHAKGYNSISVGVCLVGGRGEDGKPANNFTLQQQQALRRVVRDLQQKYPGAKVVGHRDLPKVAKACPCFDVQQFFKQDIVIVAENERQNEAWDSVA